MIGLHPVSLPPRLILHEALSCQLRPDRLSVDGDVEVPVGARQLQLRGAAYVRLKRIEERGAEPPHLDVLDFVDGLGRRLAAQQRELYVREESHSSGRLGG